MKRSLTLVLVMSMIAVVFVAPAHGASGLVAAYSFDEGSGTTVTDASGNGNSGTISGATWTAGKYGAALAFRADDSARVTIPNSASLQLTTAMTLEAWVNPSALGSVWRDVIYKGKDNYYLEASSSHSAKPAGGGKIGGTTSVSVFGNASLPQNTWTHLAVTYEGTALVLYLNGTQVSSTPVTGSILTSANALQIGGDSYFGQYFDGTIDEVRVYNTALTAAQLQTDMATPIGSSDTTPPTAPTNLTANAVSSSEIDLGWTASTDNVGVTGYLVERCQGPDCSNFAQIATTSGATYNDTNLNANTSYSYRVRATDAAKNLSDYSNVASATTQSGGPSGLVAAYSFDEGSGTTVADASGNGNNGTISGATWTSSAKYGNALVFNGTSSRVNVPNSTSLQLTNAMTLEAWVNPTTVTSAWRDVIYKGNDNYYLEATSSKSGRPVGGATIGGTHYNAVGTAVLPTSTFTHLAATYNGSAVRLFVNGNQVASTPASGSILTSGSQLQIGSDSNFGQYFAGTIDEVRIYNAALTQSQIQTDMTTPIGSGGGPFSITPKAAALTFTRTQQFTAQGGSGSVTWSVDGVAGGNSSSGTITNQGLYTPPTSVGTHTVTATASGQSANATVYITNNPGVFMHHNDTLRTGANTQETVLTQALVNQSTFGKILTYPLDGYTFASPLYVANVNVPGQGYHNLVYVATEHDSVFAFDADGTSSQPIWKDSFIDPANGVTTVPASDVSSVPDIPNEIGITATPVIDPSTGTMWVLVYTKEVSGNTTSYVYRLHALDIATGAEKATPVVVQGSVPGTGDGSVNGVLAFNPLRENGRTALLLLNGVVYLAFGSHSDVDPFHGWVFGYNATTLARVLIFCTSPNSFHSGVWQSGGGLATDATGSIYFATGDGPFDANNGNYGDTVMRMSASGTVQDYFTPRLEISQGTNNDLSAGGVLLLPDQPGPHPHEMVAAGKSGVLYLIDRDNMTHYNPAMDQNIQSIALGHLNFSNPVYWNNNVYISPINTGINAYRMTNGQLSSSPTSTTVANYDKRGGTLEVSANGTSNGILWALQSNGDSNSILHAYSAGNLGSELWNSSQAGTRDTLGPWLKFTVPLVVNGKVFVATDSQLVIYGLLP